MICHTALGLLAVLATAASAASLPPKAALQPWEMANLATYRPSGRPGSDTTATLSFRFTDTNTDASVRCKSNWTYSDASGNTWDATKDSCTVTALDPTAPPAADRRRAFKESRWNFKVVRPARGDSPDVGNDPSLYSNFDIVLDQFVDGKHYTGKGHFEVGINMKMQCAGSGFCNAGLAPDVTVGIKPSQMKQ